jgi:hypothetical protein
MKRLNFRHIYLPAILFLTFFVSCEESLETPETLSRLFRPASFTADVNGNSIHCNWTPIGNATYLLEISRDSFQFINDLKIFSVKGNDTIIVNLWSSTRYSARVKSVSKNTVTKDSGYKEITFITGK